MFFPHNVIFHHTNSFSEICRWFLASLVKGSTIHVPAGTVVTAVHCLIGNIPILLEKRTCLPLSITYSLISERIRSAKHLGWLSPWHCPSKARQTTLIESPGTCHPCDSKVVGGCHHGCRIPSIPLHLRLSHHQLFNLEKNEEGKNEEAPKSSGPRMRLLTKDLRKGRASHVEIWGKNIPGR